MPGDDPPSAAPRQWPRIPQSLWVVRVLTPDGDIWRPEKPIRSLPALPSVGDTIALDDGAPARVEGVCSPAMSGVHADIYAVPSYS